jgi:hypothetical protein
MLRLLLLLLMQVPVPSAGSTHHSGAVPAGSHAGAAPCQLHQGRILGAATADAYHLLHQPGAWLAACFYCICAACDSMLCFWVLPVLMLIAFFINMVRSLRHLSNNVITCVTSVANGRSA